MTPKMCLLMPYLFKMLNNLSLEVIVFSSWFFKVKKIQYSS